MTRDFLTARGAEEELGEVRGGPQARAAGGDPRTERFSDRVSKRMTFSAPDWSLKQAADAMTKGGFEHVVAVDRNGTAGVISIADIVGRLIA
jgi:CBS domain-containing protein